MCGAPGAVVELKRGELILQNPIAHNCMPLRNGGGSLMLTANARRGAPLCRGAFSGEATRLRIAAPRVGRSAATASAAHRRGAS
jgi:hypothetical protein